MTSDLPTYDARGRRVETRDDSRCDAVDRRDPYCSHRYGTTHDVDTTATTTPASLGDAAHETLLLKLDEVARELLSPWRSATLPRADRDRSSST